MFRKTHRRFDIVFTVGKSRNDAKKPDCRSRTPGNERKTVSSKADLRIAEAIVREIKRNHRNSGTLLKGLPERLASGSVTSEEWIKMASGDPTRMALEEANFPEQETVRG